MIPTGINGGAAPCWSFDLDFGGLLNFGTRQLCPDSAIFPMLRAVVLVSALLLAYMIVFG